ncbi:hypothetical protein AB4178_05365 [Vibrio splendidus]
MWNGEHLINKAVKEVGSSLSIDTLYLELSNLPNKIFIDSDGVNARSRFYKDFDKIVKEKVDIKLHSDWLKGYMLYKNKPLPQSIVTYKQIFFRFISKVFFIFQSKLILFSYFKSSLKPMPKPFNKNKYLFDEIDIDEVNYVFCPLQVSSDTQLTMNSDFTNIDIINNAKSLIREGQHLVVKLHPAETDESQIDKIFDMKRFFDFHIVNYSTIDLIENCELICVNNSTVGLEGMLYSKDVISYGRAIYNGFDQGYLLDYIHNILHEGVDYFGNQSISLDGILEHYKYLESRYDYK